METVLTAYLKYFITSLSALSSRSLSSAANNDANVLLLAALSVVILKNLS
jgi:hypothetical protein